MKSPKTRPPFTPEAAQRLADEYVNRFKAPHWEESHPYASIPRAPGTWDAEQWGSYWHGSGDNPGSGDRDLHDFV